MRALFYSTSYMLCEWLFVGCCIAGNCRSQSNLRNPLTVPAVLQLAHWATGL
jgi:hypothetical protein